MIHFSFLCVLPSISLQPCLKVAVDVIEHKDKIGTYAIMQRKLHSDLELLGSGKSVRDYICIEQVAAEQIRSLDGVITVIG